MKRFFAFTLAETLVVIGIIGIVSALTLPNLNSSTGEKEKVAKLQKLQTELNDAIGRAQVVYGPIHEWYLNYSDSEGNAMRADFTTKISKFLKVAKSCEINSEGCFTNKTPTNFRGGTTSTIWNLYNVPSGPRLILADGTSVYFHMWNKKCTGFHAPDGQKTGCGWIAVDLDGPNKGSHQTGKDVFIFDFSETYGVYPYGSFQTNYVPSDLYTRCFSTGDTCSAWVLDFGNLDYLKADSSGKCSNGKVLSSTVTSCK